jgi:F-type H+-transporting ATPase subunit b
MLSAALGTILWTSIAFLIVLFLMKKLAWKPILSLLKERETSIEEALQSAEKAKLEFASLQAKNDDLLKEARVEREAMMKEAKTEKENIISTAKNTAKEEGAKMIQKAKEEIEKEKVAAVDEIKSQIGAISISIAEKIIKKEFTNKEEQNALIQDQLKNLDNKTATLN